MLASFGWLTPSAATEDDGLGAVLRRLGILLPPDVSSQPQIARPLDQLRRERCDQTAILQFQKEAAAAGYRREAANALISFSGQCGDNPSLLRTAVNTLLKLSDYQQAVEVSNKVIELAPHNDNGYFLRALAYDGLKDRNRAIADYITAIELFGDKDRIASIGYFKMSDNYAALGQYCEAMRPVNAWIALNPGRNDNSQTRTMLATLARRGNCTTEASGAAEIIKIPGGERVIKVAVQVNGTPGTFLLDTGATFVSVRRSFASSARLSVREHDQIQLHTANGIGKAVLGRAESIKLGKVEARNVTVAVQTDNDGAYGRGVDGLLGMSFLSRFDLKLDRQTATIRPRMPER